MAKTMILPAALRYQGEVATAVNAVKAAGVDNGPQGDLLRSLTSTIGEFQKATADLEHAIGHHVEGEPLDHAKFSRDKVLPAMAAVRALGDKLETRRGRRPVAAADLPRDAVHQVSPLPAASASERVERNPLARARGWS